jgi:hypothetical protein
MRRSPGMGRKKIDEQTVAQWIHLRRKGRSYRSIGEEFEVDSRTVKAWVQRAGKEKEKEHWEAVSRQVDAKYLDEHYRMLLQIAAAVLDAVHNDPVFVHQKLDARDLLNNSVQSAVQKSADLLAGRGLDMSSAVSEFYPRTGIKDHKAQRLGHRLLDALMEHEPQLKMAIEAWESDWSRFQHTRLQLIEAAKNLFKHANTSDRIAEALKIEVVREALRNKLLGEEPCSSLVDVLDEKITHLIRYSEGAERRILTGSKQEVEAARKAYDKVLSQLSHEERVKPMEDRYHSLMNRVREVEDYIDQLILMGKAQGQCALCLNRSIHLT